MNKPSLRICGVMVPLVLATAGCTTLRVTSDVNTSLASSVQCHTFAWAGSFHGSSDSLRGTVANPVNESRLRAAIEANLKSKGIQPVASAATEPLAPGAPAPAGTPGPPTGTAGAPAFGGADCLVGYGIGNRTAIEGGYPYGPGLGWGWGWGWGWRGGYAAWDFDYPYVYQEGLIAVDLYDAKSRQPLWHASVNQSLYSATGPKAEQKINDAVAAIFTKYPH